jgi:hypothetical protein
MAGAAWHHSLWLTRQQRLTGLGDGQKQGTVLPVCFVGEKTLLVRFAPQESGHHVSAAIVFDVLLRLERGKAREKEAGARRPGPCHF